MNADARLIALAAGALALTLALGAYVVSRPFTPVDIASIALRGEATPLAILFTRSGYWQALTGIFIVVFSLCMMFRRDPTFVIGLAAAQLLSQLAVDGIKLIFKRTRPDQWLFHKEIGYSFRGGHADHHDRWSFGVCTAVFGWSMPIPRPFRLAATFVLAIWIVGIPWSRMALGAHYGTDVIGGMLFGVTWLCLMFLVLRHLMARPRSGRSATCFSVGRVMPPSRSASRTAR